MALFATGWLNRSDKTTVADIMANVQGTDEEKAKIQGYLNALNQTEIGRDVIAEMPRDVSISFDKLDGAHGCYYNGIKKIVLNDEPRPSFDCSVTLAHEMRHAVQKKDGIVFINFENQNDEAVVSKLCELDTKLQDARLENQLSALLEYQDAKLTTRGDFLNRLVTAEKGKGLSEEQANQAARDKFIKSYWGGRVADGVEIEVDKEIQEEISWWNESYNSQTLNNMSCRDVGLIHKKGVEGFIDQYREQMGTSLDTDYFKKVSGVTFKQSELEGGIVLCQKYSADGVLLADKQLYDVNRYVNDGIMYFLIPEIKDKHSIDRTFYPNGRVKSVQSFVNRQAEGHVKRFYESGQLEEESTYKNGQLEGPVKIYHENGQLQEEHNRKNGKIEGALKTYYENGQLQGEGNFKNGKLEGVIKTYYENGQLKGEGNFKNGKREGAAKFYHENGQLKEEHNYQDGQRSGTQKEYDESGNILKVSEYKGGTLLHSETVQQKQVAEQAKTETTQAQVASAPVIPKGLGLKGILAQSQHPVQVQTVGSQQQTAPAPKIPVAVPKEPMKPSITLMAAQTGGR